MKVITKVLLLSLGLGLLAFAGGCGSTGLPAGKSPEDVIKEALLNQPELTEAVFEVTANADLKGTVGGENNNLNGDFVLSGSSNSATGQMSVMVELDATMNGESVKATLEVRANEDGVFVKIAKVELSDADSQELVELFLADYLGSWVKLGFITSKELVESGYADVEYDEGDPLPFKNIEYVGNISVLGLDSYHFTADFDEEMLLDLMQGDSAEAQEFLDVAEIKGDVYVAVKENILSGFGGVITLNEDEMKGAVEVQIKINPTKSNTVVTPDYDKELTQEDIQNMISGGSIMPPIDDAMFDDAMFDDAMFDDIMMGDDVMSEAELAEFMAEFNQ